MLLYAPVEMYAKWDFEVSTRIASVTSRLIHALLLVLQAGRFYFTFLQAQYMVWAGMFMDDEDREVGLEIVPLLGS